MRTVTEFFGMTLKAFEEKLPTITEEATAAATAATTESMKGEGKSDEEIAAALPAAIKAAVDAKIGETQKLEGDKLAMFSNALAAMREARGGGKAGVKRVIVMAPTTEGEKAPAGAKEIDGKFYFVENFVEAQRAAPRDEGRGGRDGKRGGRGGKGGRDDKRGGGRGPRGPGRGGDRPGMEAGSSEPRAPRAPREPVAPYVGPNRIGGAKPAAPAGGETKSE